MPLLLKKRTGPSVPASEGPMPGPGFSAEDVEKMNVCQALQRHHDAALRQARDLVLRRNGAPGIHALLTTTRDRITTRLLDVVEHEMDRDGFGPPPAPYAWMSLGSAGRREETLAGRQINIIVHDDRNDAEITTPKHNRPPEAAGGTNGPGRRTRSTPYYRELSQRMAERLSAVGLGACETTGPFSPRERTGSVEDWKKKIRESMHLGRGPLRPSDIMAFADARPVSGDQRLSRIVLNELFGALRKNGAIIKGFVRSAILFETALGLFGRFRRETEGRHRGTFHAGLRGWTPLVTSIRAFSLSHGIEETNTLLRIRVLREEGLISSGMERDLEDAYLSFMNFRLFTQTVCREAEEREAVHVNPDMLDEAERQRLRASMRTVEAFQKHMYEYRYSGGRRKGKGRVHE